MGKTRCLSLVLAPALELPQRDPELEQPLEILPGHPRHRPSRTCRACHARKIRPSAGPPPLPESLAILYRRDRPVRHADAADAPGRRRACRTLAHITAVLDAPAAISSCATAGWGAASISTPPRRLMTRPAQIRMRATHQSMDESRERSTITRSYPCSACRSRSGRIHAQSPMPARPASDTTAQERPRSYPRAETSSSGWTALLIIICIA